MDSYSVLSLASQTQREESVLKLGTRVVILKGKYSGKEGALSDVNDHAVTVIEDVSKLRVRFI